MSDHPIITDSSGYLVAAHNDDELRDYRDTLRAIVGAVLEPALRAGNPLSADHVIEQARRTWDTVPGLDVEHALGDLERLGLACEDREGNWAATEQRYRRRTGVAPRATACLHEHRCTRATGHDGDHLPRPSTRDPSDIGA